MVEFTNIHFDGEYIYAVETDVATGNQYKVRVHKNKEEYYSEPALPLAVQIRALWYLQKEYAKKGTKIGEKFVVAWA